MEWRSTWTDPFQEYLKPFASLIGDRRTWGTLLATVKGIIASGSVIGERIAACSEELSQSKNGAQRVLRMAKGESTKRSELDAEALTARLRQVGVEQLQESEAEEVWLIADGSDLCKPYAQEMPYLMQVRDKNKKLVPGYRTLTVLAVTPKRRGILYQKVLSSEEPGFLSEPAEVQTMLATVHQAVREGQVEAQVSWLLDSGFDDVAVWRTIWEQEDHVVCRVCQRTRLVEWQTESGAWSKGPLEEAAKRLKTLALVRAKMEVPLGKQAHPKQQEVEVEISACSFRLAYHSEVRRCDQGPDQLLHKDLWLVQVRLLNCPWEPWWLITDWPVTTEAEAMRIFSMYRQRWGVEESFKFTRSVAGLGGRASSRLAGHQDVGSVSLGCSGLFVRDGRDVFLGRGPIARQTRRLCSPSWPLSGQDRLATRSGAFAGDARHAGDSLSLCFPAWDLTSQHCRFLARSFSSQ